jgi:hypothetical protein
MPDKDWDLIWTPFPDGPPPIEGGRLGTEELVTLVKSENPIIRRLAQEAVCHRWAECDWKQGSE